MNTITLTARGQFTINKQLLEHMGVQGGEKVLVKKQPDGSLKIESAKKTRDYHTLFGILGKSEVHMTDAEMKTFIENAHAEAGMKGLQNESRD
jgi:bifunctional DNA-binding transcriptional regulator/antitoxin component of YhaV-PrlF toxin-antitoxin module